MLIVSLTSSKQERVWVVSYRVDFMKQKILIAVGIALLEDMMSGPWQNTNSLLKCLITVFVNHYRIFFQLNYIKFPILAE